MDKEEIEEILKANRFVKEMDLEGWKWINNGREFYVIKNVFKPIQELETKIKELGKGQQTLIRSRAKWKRRYYKERRKVKELEQEKQDGYWKGYIQKQNEAMEICKICKYRTKARELEEREQKVKDICCVRQIKALQQMDKELMVEYHFAEEILNLLEGEKE